MPISLRSILILFSQLPVGPQRCLFPVSLSGNILKAPQHFSISSHFNVLDLITPTVLCEWY